MVVRVPIDKNMLIWARERAGKNQDELLSRFPKIAEWEAETTQPTLKQLEDFANAVHVPFGYLFLSKPPEEPVPLPDFRTVKSEMVRRPSPDLLDTVHICKERQAWFRDHVRQFGSEGLEFVGSARLSDRPELIAKRIATKLSFAVEDRVAISDVDASMRAFVSKLEDIGILVMISGIVGSNTSRALDPSEFRGFALSDVFAPLIFINGADAKSARLFTLAHELAHIWLGMTALSNASAAPLAQARTEEAWCNKVAAELLVPEHALREDVASARDLPALVAWLRRKYKVSALVILRRLLDVEYLSRPAFDLAWSEELARLRAADVSSTEGGGDFYRTTASRVGRRFAKAVISSTLEGQTLFRDAHRMLGIAKTETFNEFGRVIGATL
jgi:Zn-dependent peptidase ImmA (M78 family)/transcriptional regulator with XRE-family HTH domain